MLLWEEVTMSFGEKEITQLMTNDWRDFNLLYLFLTVPLGDDYMGKNAGAPTSFLFLSYFCVHSFRFIDFLKLNLLG